MDFTEFAAAALDRQKILNRERIGQTFKLFDLDGDGEITKNEMQQLLGEIDNEIWQEMMGSIDFNGDGKVMGAHAK